MILRILLPDRLLYEAEVQKVVAETTAGSRGFLPNHIDYVAALRRGIIIATDLDDREHYAAVDRGVLVKKGDVVTVTSPRAVASDRLETLNEAIQELRVEQDHQEYASRRAMMQLETRLVKEFLGLVR